MIRKFYTRGNGKQGKDISHLNWGTSNAKTLTLTFYVKSSVTGQYYISVFNSAANRTLLKGYTISSAGTWEKKTITYDGDTTGAFGNDNNVSLSVFFWLGAGSDYTGGTFNNGTWGSGGNNTRVSSSQVNLADSTANEWYITGVQLEAGTAASDFEFLPHDVNFNRCRRYYEKFDNSGDPDSEMYWIGIACADTNTDARTVLKYYPKRANPSTSFTGTVRVDPGNRTTTTMYFDTQRTQSSLFYFNAFSASGSASDALYMRFNTTSSKIELNSEL